MRPRQPLMFSALLLCLGAGAFAQPWSGIINPSRAIDWSSAGIPGGIPTRPTNCATLNPGASSAQINSAIASCPAGQVVYLNAGTYQIGSGINFNGHGNITLRGAGPTQTILKFTGGDSCNGLGGDICVINNNAWYSGSAAVQPGGSDAASWTGGYARGTTQITLSKTSGLAVGSLLILDQANDTSDTNGVFVCDSGGPTVCHQNGETGSLGRIIGGVTYAQEQVVSVTAISGNTVTISPGVYANNWRASQNPGAWWPGQITQVGIENMTVDHSASTSVASGIYLYDCYECWVKNVKSLKANRNHVWFYQSARDVVRDSYFYGTQNAASQSYGVEFLGSSDDLVENNVFDTVASPIMFADGQGVVIGYNYAVNDYYTVSLAWMMAAFSSHDAGNALNLFEGNDLNGLNCDDEHGTGNLGTWFRNQLAGWQSGKSLNTSAVNLSANCRGYNIIGNVLGKAGYHSHYESAPALGNVSSSSCDATEYQLGWAGSECGTNSSGGVANDPLTRSTLLRWGNFDVVNGAQWNAAEVPTTGVPYINGNSVPSSHTLPNSFYTSGKPSFWGSMPWPAAGPDVAGGTDSTGHVYANPAQVCYNNTPKDGNGILMFDATACYTQQGSNKPAPPSGVSAIAH